MTLNRREASPDSTPVCLNRREAEMGFGDEIPIVTPSAKRNPR